MWYLRVKSMEAFFLCVSSSLCLCAGALCLPCCQPDTVGKKDFVTFSLFTIFYFGFIASSFWDYWGYQIILGARAALRMGIYLLYSTLQWEGKEVVVITHCALESFQTLSGYQSWRWRELEDQLYLELKLWKRLKQNLWRFQLGLSSSVHWLILLLFT